MGVGGGVDNDALGRTPCRLDPVDQSTFMIGLMKRDGKTENGRSGVARGLNIGKGFATIDLRLARAE